MPVEVRPYKFRAVIAPQWRRVDIPVLPNPVITLFRKDTYFSKKILGRDVTGQRFSNGDIRLNMRFGNPRVNDIINSHNTPWAGEIRYVKS